MRLKISCSIKYLLETCPFQDIQKLETTIEQLKKNISVIESQIIKLENLLKLQEINKIVSIGLSYNDNYSFKNLPYREYLSCPYSSCLCHYIKKVKEQTVYQLRLKLNHFTSYYNALLSTICDVQINYHSHKTNKLFIRYYQPSKYNFAFFLFDLTQFLINPSNPHLILAFSYTKEIGLIKKQILVKYESQRIHLYGTSAWSTYKSNGLLHCLNMDECIQLNTSFIFTYFKELSTIINTHSKFIQLPIKEIYGKLSSDTNLLSKVIICYLKKEHVKLLGKFTENEGYLENQILYQSL